MTRITSEIAIFFSEIRRFYKAFLEEIKSVNLSDKEKIKLKWDYISELLKHRFRFNEYYNQYMFPKLTHRERSEFISLSEMQHIYRKYGNPEIREIFRDKAKFLKIFRSYVKRQWMFWDGCTEDSKRKLEHMLSRFDCIVKPLDGTLGDGVKKINKDAIADIDDFVRTNLSDGKYVVEECITAHPEMAEFHPASLNSIRVVTFSNGIESEIFGAFLRMGNNNRCIDNAHGGGLFAQIDVDTGMIVCDGLDTNGNTYEIHPTSKKKIKGFVIPNWENVKKMCVDASLVLPKIRFAGWDVAVRENGDIEFIEGNHAPDFDLMQSPLKIGVRKKNI